MGQDWLNPQSLNRYTYCSNNPLKYTDPTGHWGLSNIGNWVKKNIVEPIKETCVDIKNTAVSVGKLIADPSVENLKNVGINLGKSLISQESEDMLAYAFSAEGSLGDKIKASLMAVADGASNVAMFTGAGTIVKVGKGIVGKEVAGLAEKQVVKTVVKSEAKTAAREGVVYLRTNPLTGKNYVGRTINFAERQAQHNRKFGIKFEYTKLGTAEEGLALRKMEEGWIRKLGGPGVLENKRYEMNDLLYKSLDGNIPLP